MQRRRKGILAGLVGAVMGVTLMVGGTVLATDPVDFTFDPAAIGRFTLAAFRFRQPDFRIISPEKSDVVMGEFTIGLGGHTGWHTHPGPTFATVASGEVELITLLDNGRCAREKVKAGDGFGEPGGLVHIAVNTGDEPAVLVITFFAIEPRAELPGAVIDWAPPAPRHRTCALRG